MPYKDKRDLYEAQRRYRKRKKKEREKFKKFWIELKNAIESNNLSQAKQIISEIEQLRYAF